MRICKKILLISLLGVFSLQLFAQSAKGKASIRGNVFQVENGVTMAVDYAVVSLLPTQIYATTDEKGNFVFEKVDPGKYTISIQYVGMESLESEIVVASGKDYNLEFEMKLSNFKLDEVTVVAEKSKAGDATASKISRQAMDHLQTGSLKDVMSLLPGVTMSNPSLAQAQVFTIRTISGDASTINSLGTALYVDGSPLSNNANMQSLSPVMTGNSNISGGGVLDATPEVGVDLRNISTDNVESIEVIRGIPSAEYGDLTSGAVIVKSKAGKDPLTIRFKTNPTIYQGSISKGFQLGAKGGNLNISGDYAHARDKTTESYAYFQRVNLKALYSKTFNKLNTNTSLEFNMGIDTRKRNPDDESLKKAQGAKNIGYRFNTNGSWTVNLGWLKTINYSLSNSYTDKVSFKEEMLTNGVCIYSTNMTSGTTVSNHKGMKIYDSMGNEITKFNLDQNDVYSTYTPFQYFSHYDVYGKELNTFAKMSANFSKSWKSTSNRILVGVDYKNDGNLGDGLVFKEGVPPQRSSNEGAGFRMRKNSEIPFLNQLGVFVEDGFKQYFADREFSLTAGARFDWINGKTSITPRVNASIDILPRILILRGGYGIQAKAPTAYYLYPQDAYYDQTNYNGLNSQKDEDKIVVSTTHIFDSKNPDLEIAKNRKAEIGLDLYLANRFRFSVTGYAEKMRNGYSYSTDIDSYHWLRYVFYEQDKSSTGAGVPPTLKVARDINTFFTTFKPMNDISVDNYGVEYELDLGRFEAIRTAFYINGAWMKSAYSENSYHFTRRAKQGNTLESNIAIYEKNLSTSYSEQFLTTLRITHNIPRIGFVVTLTAQASWFDSSWNRYGQDELPIMYISNKDGKVYDFTPEMKDDPEFSYMIEQKSDSRFIVDKTIPTVVLNLNLSKEIGDFLTASFFVNNMFNSRPLDPSEVSVGAYTELNANKKLFFGFDLKIKIK